MKNVPPGSMSSSVPKCRMEMSSHQWKPADKTGMRTLPNSDQLAPFCCRQAIRGSDAYTQERTQSSATYFISWIHSFLDQSDKLVPSLTTPGSLHLKVLIQVSQTEG